MQARILQPQTQVPGCAGNKLAYACYGDRPEHQWPLVTCPEPPVKGMSAEGSTADLFCCDTPQSRGACCPSTIVVELGREVPEQEPRGASERCDLRAQRRAVQDARGAVLPERRHAPDRPRKAELEVAGRDQTLLARAVVAVAVDDREALSLVRQHDAEAGTLLGARRVDGRTGGRSPRRPVVAARATE